MKDIKSCKIVQDLLPNYIEKLTNDETNKFVELHLNECEECKKVYNNMKKELEPKTEQIDKLFNKFQTLPRITFYKFSINLIKSI